MQIGDLEIAVGGGQHEIAFGAVDLPAQIVAAGAIARKVLNGALPRYDCVAHVKAVRDIVAVARDGDVMPQKSTYFFPKALTGLVINPHEW